ncbi:hypothetical protein [Parasitella parasitica]|uniref:Uncharacterized protein n=1 Tax=Parasitella parasitica TaxID=35722 RepID=A0A0B7NLB2_9FUNG|nr:hypothetical protein [Parasitella parasitica]
MTIKTSQILNRIARFFTSEPSSSASPLTYSVPTSASSPSVPAHLSASNQKTIIEHYQSLKQIGPYTPKKSRWATLAAGKKIGKKTLTIMSSERFEPSLRSFDSGISVSSFTTESSAVADSCAIPVSPIVTASSTISISSTLSVECVYDEKVEIQIPPAPTFAFRTKAIAFRGYRTMPIYPSSSQCLSPVFEVPEEYTPRNSVELQQSSTPSITLDTKIQVKGVKTVTFADSAIFEENEFDIPL